MYLQQAMHSGGYCVYTMSRCRDVCPDVPCYQSSAFCLRFVWILNEFREVITTTKRWTDYILGEIVTRTTESKSDETTQSCAHSWRDSITRRRRSAKDEDVARKNKSALFWLESLWSVCILRPLSVRHNVCWLFCVPSLVMLFQSLQ